MRYFKAHKKDVTPGMRPVKERAYKVTPEKKEIHEDIVKEMLKQGTI